MVELIGVWSALVTSTPWFLRSNASMMYDTASTLAWNIQFFMFSQMKFLRLSIVSFFVGLVL